MVSVVFSIASAMYLFSLNPSQPDAYAWKARKVFPNNTDCLPYSNRLGIVCVSTFFFGGGGVSFAAIVPSYVSLSSVIITPALAHSTVFMSYNYSGPDWVLQVGME